MKYQSTSETHGLTSGKKRHSFSALAFAIFTIMTLCNMSQAQYQSVNRTMQFTSNYSVDYFTHNLNGVLSVRFFLKLIDVDISNWTSQGSKGIWLGIGFGQQVMYQADMVQCQLKFTNNSKTDRFICNDRYGSSPKSLP